MTEDIAPATHTILNRSSLHRVICARHESITRLLLKQGADTNRRDSNGHTALHLGVQTGHEGLVKTLIEIGKVDPNVQDALGQTALFHAVQCDNESMARLLLEASVDVNCKDTFGDVALHVAVERGSEVLIQLLLSYGADIDA